MVNRGAAPVRPRVLISEGSDASLLEDEVRARLVERRWGMVELVGAAGSGKSVALDHLRHVFPDDSRLRVVDRPNGATSDLLLDMASYRLVVCASPTFFEPPDCLERWRLAMWSLDECIEYLLTVHREKCASVMRRVQADPLRQSLGGLAGLWCVVLDRLAANESLGDVNAAVRQELDVHLPATIRPLVSECAFYTLMNSAAGVIVANRLFKSGQIGAKARALLRHEPVNMRLAAEYVVDQLRSDAADFVLQKRLPASLIMETATLVHHDDLLLEKLRKVVASREHHCHATAASLLSAADVGWVPGPGKAPFLSLAYLAGARWRGVRLSKLEILQTDLTDADLSESQLQNVRATKANLSGINLHGSQLVRFNAIQARLTGADLSFVRATDADFSSADLRDANLEGALLAYGNFKSADLRGAVCCRANFANATFWQCPLDGADFSGADLSWASIDEAVLRVARFNGAKFAHTRLIQCDLEYMSLPGANFESAILHEAHLTGSHMPAANFQGADLTLAGLAEIDWPRADLRNADLRGATFHMGSSRSGLVGSPIASEGSRTGFYTDELYEQGFKAPEEIRKANLCGADLRGAKIDDVDFYLVDLRGAWYSAEQEAQLRSSGAILETRV
jgi:uncharacterized protein YjbI with pentapeptide repeats